MNNPIKVKYIQEKKYIYEGGNANKFSIKGIITLKDIFEEIIKKELQDHDIHKTLYSVNNIK